MQKYLVYTVPSKSQQRAFVLLVFGREGCVWFEGSPMYPAIFGLEAIIRKGLTKGRGLYILISMKGVYTFLKINGWFT